MIHQFLFTQQNLEHWTNFDPQNLVTQFFNPKYCLSQNVWPHKIDSPPKLNAAKNEWTQDQWPPEILDSQQYLNLEKKNSPVFFYPKKWMGVKNEWPPTINDLLKLIDLKNICIHKDCWSQKNWMSKFFWPSKLNDPQNWMTPKIEWPPNSNDLQNLINLHFVDPKISRPPRTPLLCEKPNFKSVTHRHTDTQHSALFI